MFIKVMYQNGETATVEAYQLDELITQNRIKKFLRSGGWCTVGVDPTRKTERLNYQGQERSKDARKGI